MKVVILAGGLGTRLRSVVNEVPKPLAPIKGIPYLAYMLRVLYEKGLREFILSVGYKSEHFDAFVATQRKTLPAIKLEVLVEPEPLGTGGAIKYCFEHYQDDRYLIFNGDSFCDFHLEDLLDAATQHGASMVIAKVSNISRYGEVTIKPDGQVEAFHEKQPVNREGLINAGMYCLPGNIFADYEGPASFSFEQNIMPGILARGLYTVPATGQFIDIGIPEDYQTLANHPEYYFEPLPLWLPEAAPGEGI